MQTQDKVLPVDIGIEDENRKQIAQGLLSSSRHLFAVSQNSLLPLERHWFSVPLITPDV